jgi:hypothetical protein
MTEAEWLGCDNVFDLLYFLSKQPKQPSDRKYRLFAVACCQRIRRFLIDVQSWKAVEAAEQFADGLIAADCLDAAGRWPTYTEGLPPGQIGQTCNANDTACYAAARAAAIETAWQAAGDACDTAGREGWNSSPGIAALVANRQAAGVAGDAPFDQAEADAFDAAYDQAQADQKAAAATERQAQTELVREVFGNPFTSVVLSATWLSLSVLSLAQGIYDDRAFDRLPILADAFEEAGCTDDAILSHLRGPGPHVRGCWAVDLLLGKQ